MRLIYVFLAFFVMQIQVLQASDSCSGPWEDVPLSVHIADNANEVAKKRSGSFPVDSAQVPVGIPVEDWVQGPVPSRSRSHSVSTGTQCDILEKKCLPCCCWFKKAKK